MMGARLICRQGWVEVLLTLPMDRSFHWKRQCWWLWRSVIGREGICETGKRNQAEETRGERKEARQKWHLVTPEMKTPPIQGRLHPWELLSALALKGGGIPRLKKKPILLSFSR